MPTPKPTNWRNKEARELFCKTTNSYIIKCGADKDPIIEEVLKIAKKVVDTAFENYPDQEENPDEHPL